MLKKTMCLALFAGAIFAPAAAWAGGLGGASDWYGDGYGWRGGPGHGWRGDHHRPYGGWNGGHRSGCWRWWYGRWVWAC